MNRTTYRWARISASILIFGSFALFLNFRSSDDPRITKIMNQLTQFTTRCNQQKIYLHTDKSVYIAGESIWMKAYLLNINTFQPDVNSNEIYVDLVDRNKITVQSIILQNNNGIADGDIALGDSLPEGNYQLVAYTNWMKNFDEAYYFSKTLKIKNPQYEKYVTSTELNDISKYNGQNQKLEQTQTIQFFPEGGNMVAGLSGRIAFKAMNGLGLGIKASGEVFDDSNAKIVHFETKHLGMGVFSFTPETGHKYYANVTFSDGKSKKFDLPAIEQNGYSLMVNAIAGSQIRIAVQSNLKAATDEKDNEVIVVGQSRGIIQYISKGSIKGKPLNASIPKKQFPAGIAQITIFNGNGEPVCERLVFIQPKETAQRSILKVSSRTEGDDIIYQFNIDQATGQHQAGNLSLSMYESIKEDNAAWNENILSNLLVTSDLQGKIEGAADYFNDSNPEAILDLDNVMMINGWRRFVWKEILAGYLPTLIYSPSEGIGADEMMVTSQKAFKYDLSNKSFADKLNENYNPKMVKENTKREAKNNPGNGGTGTDANAISHKTLTGYSNMVQYLKGRLAGVTVSDNGIKIHGAVSVVAGTDPLILLDDQQISFDQLKNTSPNDVESVEALKGPDASIYGARGANGVIILHMRNAKLNNNQVVSTSGPQTERVISFYKSREFYVPTYDSWTHKPAESQVPRAIAWKPNITVDSTGVATLKVKNRMNIGNITTSVEGIAADGSVLYFLDKK